MTTPIKYRISSTATKPTADSVKGAPLTSLEIDGNFRSIKDSIETIQSGYLPAGYTAPVEYAAGIILSSASQTVSYQGEVYAPKAAEVPFTASGTFEVAKFVQIQSVAGVDLAASSGSSLVGYDGGTVQDVLDGAKSLQDYAALRAYTGRAKRIYITGLLITAKPAGIAGPFQYDPTDTTSLDNNGTVIVLADGRRFKRDFNGSVKVGWFEVVGGLLKDETGNIQAAVDFAKSVNKGVDLCGLTCIVSSVRVKNGLRFLKNGTLIPSGRTAKAAILLEGGSIGGAAVTRFSLQNLYVDCSNNPEHVVYGEGCTYCTFENNNFYNLQGNLSPVNHGIMLCEGSKYNRIAFNTIQAAQYSLNGVMIGLFSAGVDAYYGYFSNATGNITAPANPCEHNVIVGNRVYGGQQGIWISGGNKNNVGDNNIEGQRDRGIILIASTKNTISGNNIYDSKSSGIHMAYGCTRNGISGNTVVQPNSAGGEAGIQAYVGCGGNTIVGNNIQTESNFGIYVAVSSNFNVIHSNRITRYAIAGICIQSDWWGSGGQGVYGRPNYGDPATGNKWAFTDIVGNSIKDNYIEEPSNVGNISGNDCGIALIQSKSADGVSQYKVKNTDVCGNKVQTSSLTHNVYVFSDVANGLSGNNLIGNTFSDPSIAKFSGNNFVSPDAFSYAFDQIVQNSGLNTYQTWLPEVQGSTTAGTATYTKQFGRYVRVDRNFVEFEIELSWTGHTGTGGTTITLPLAVKTTGQGGFVTPITVESTNVTLNTSKWLSALVGAGNAVINVYEFQSGTIEDYLSINAAGTLRLSGRYQIR